MARGSKKKQKQPKQSGKGTWKLFDRGATVASALLARQAATITWRVATNKKPPTATQHPDVRTIEALTWAAFAGATVELTRVIINRKTVDYWVRSTGKLPPGLKSLEDMDKKRRKRFP